MTPRILLFDIENAPIITYAWDIHGEGMHSTDFVKEDWYIMCWAAKWLGEKKIHSSALPDFKGYKKNPKCDKKVVKALWDMLNEADIAIAHNGLGFDTRKFNARCLIHGLPPPSPYRMIDTLLIARKRFMFTSNKLGDLGKYLGVGDKVSTGGFQLWKDCMAQDMKAWKRMVDYCKGDITLLEKVYLKLRPFMARHPNLAVFSENKEIICAKCGSVNTGKRGLTYTNTSVFQRYSCYDCGGWGRLKVNMKENKTKVMGI